MLQFQVSLDELFAYTKVYHSGLAEWGSSGPFLGQSVLFFIAQYPLMPRYPNLK
jgi:hypothetical protein